MSDLAQASAGMTIPQALALAGAHREAGRLQEAEALCREVLRVAPNHGEALHQLGIVAHQAGNIPAAIELVRRASEAPDAIGLYLSNLCEMLRVSGNPRDAVAAGRRAIALDPSSAAAFNNLGVAYYDTEEFAAAAEVYERALALDPEFAEAASNLGNALRAQKKLEEALVAYRRAVVLRPGYAAAYNNMGTGLRDMKRLEEAEKTYRMAFALTPEDPSVLNNLALTVSDLERKEEALALLRRSVKLNAQNHQTWTYLASVLIDLDRVEEAEAAGLRALALKPEDADALNTMGRIAAEREKSEEAIEYYRRALAQKPDLADAHNNMGNALKELGLMDEARAAFEKAIELSPRMTGAFFNLADGKKFREGDPHLLAMEELEQDLGSFTEEEQTQLHFALGKAYGDLGQHRRSFAKLLEGNALKRRRIVYDEPAVAGLFERIEAVFTPELLRRKRGLGEPSDVPVFVVGMPRSGTTLVEQILASHPAVHGAGELDDLNRLILEMKGAGGEPIAFPDAVPQLAGELGALGRAYLTRVRARAPEARRITDKMPSNFLFAGLIHLALPNARVIHTRRDPIDTCLSCFSKLFSGEQNQTYDLAELGRYYRRYDRLMKVWHRVLPRDFLLEVEYEAVVDDLEGQARRIIAHAGLPWDPACLAFHETQRPVRTASATQVRQPIYKSAIGRWQPYKDQLGPLLAELPPGRPG